MRHCCLRDTSAVEFIRRYAIFTFAAEAPERFVAPATTLQCASPVSSAHHCFALRAPSPRVRHVGRCFMSLSVITRRAIDATTLRLCFEDALPTDDDAYALLYAIAMSHATRYELSRLERLLSPLLSERAVTLIARRHDRRRPPSLSTPTSPFTTCHRLSPINRPRPPCNTKPPCRLAEGRW